MKTKVKKSRARILPGLLSLAATLAASYAGILFLGDIGTRPSVICLVLLLAMSVYSAVFAVKFNREMQSIKIEDNSEIILEDKKKAEKDYNAYLSELRHDILFFYLWLAAAAIISLLMIVMAAGVTTFFRGLLTAMSMVMLWGVFDLLLPTRKSVRGESGALPREEFPELYAVAEEVFPEDRRSLTICIHNYADFSVARNAGRLTVVMGALDALSMNSSELKSLFTHEKFYISCLKGDATFTTETITNRFSNHMQRRGFFLPFDILMEYPRIRLEGTYFYAYPATIAAKEMKACEYVKNNADPESYFSGLEKIKAIDVFSDYESDATKLFYETESVPEHAVSENYGIFLKTVDERRKLWLGLLERETATDCDLCPSFSEIRRYFGISELSLDFQNGSEYRDRILDFCDRQLMEMNLKDYGKNRESLYLTPLSVIEKYDAAEAEGREYSVLEMRPVLNACEELNMTDRLIELCRRTIDRAETVGEASHAHYLLGKALLRRYNSEGLEHVLLAMDENTNYLDGGSTQIQKFCTLMGMREELEDYNSKIMAMNQRAKDKNLDAANMLNAIDTLLEENVLPQVQAEKNIKFIVSTGGERLKTLWQVRKQLTPVFFTTVYVMDFTPDTTEEERAEIYGKVFAFLDVQNRQYSLFFRDECRGVNLDKIENSRVYEKQTDGKEQ